MFFLCTYADQERWVSAFEPLLYPCGLSFYRTFSYKKDYFVPEQLANLSQLEVLIKNLHRNEGVFGVRFREETTPDFRQIFIPLRKVTITSVDQSDELNVRFRLGPFVEPDYVESTGERTMPTLNVSALVGDISKTKLFLELRDGEDLVVRKWRYSDSFPQEFLETVAKSLSPRAKDFVRNSVLLRLIELRERGKLSAIQPAQIDDQNHVWGYQLREGKSYNLRLSFKRLVEKGGARPPIEHVFTLTSPPDELQAARRTVQIVGNYRSEELWICPTSAKPGPIMIAFEPSRIDAPNSVVDQTMSKMVGVKIPVLVIPKMWPTARIVNVIFAIACLLGFLASIRLYSASTPDAQKILLLIMTALASMFVTALKDVFIPKH
jgi:hypothetical protein